MFGRIFVLALCAATFTASVSHAQTPTGLSATAFDDIPAGTVLEVRAGRDLPLERDLVDEISKLLSARGYTVADRGDVIVTVDSTTPLPGVDARSTVTVDQRLRTMGTRGSDEGVRVPFNNKNAAPGAAVFTLRMSAYRPGESNLWVGRASGPDNGGGRKATTLALAKSLTSVFGQSTSAAPPE